MSFWKAVETFFGCQMEDNVSSHQNQQTSSAECLVALKCRPLMMDEEIAKSDIDT